MIFKVFIIMQLDVTILTKVLSKSAHFVRIRHKETQKETEVKILSAVDVAPTESNFINQLMMIWLNAICLFNSSRVVFINNVLLKIGSVLVWSDRARLLERWWITFV